MPSRRLLQEQEVQKARVTRPPAGGHPSGLFASAIQRDGNLDRRQREHLYRELISAVLESGA